jgi:hypothetical protein
MFIMTKLIKRLRKTIGDTTNVLVVGSGFGNLENLLEIANTVFVISKEPPTIKSKKLVYRRNFDDLTSLPEISSIFVDRNLISDIPRLAALWTRYKSKVVIEGPPVIDREFSKHLSISHWNAVEQTETFHIWKKKE